MKRYLLFFKSADPDDPESGDPSSESVWMVGTLSQYGYISDDVIDSHFDVFSQHTNFDDALLALEVLVKADQIKERP